MGISSVKIMTIGVILGNEVTKNFISDGGE